MRKVDAYVWNIVYIVLTMSTKRQVIGENGQLYWAAIDVVTEMCPGYTPADARRLLSALSQKKKGGEQVTKLLSRKHQFPGQRQQFISILTPTETDALRQFLPAKYLLTAGEDTPRCGFVYAAFSTGNGMKIATTMKKDPMLRLKQLDASVRDPFKLVNFVHCEHPNVLNKLIHEELEAYRVGKHNTDLFEVKQEYISALFDSIKQGLHDKEVISEVFHLMPCVFYRGHMTLFYVCMCVFTGDGLSCCKCCMG